MYQEIHPYRAISISSIKINTSLTIMREVLVTQKMMLKMLTLKRMMMMMVLWWWWWRCVRKGGETGAEKTKTRQLSLLFTNFNSQLIFSIQLISTTHRDPSDRSNPSDPVDPPWSSWPILLKLHLRLLLFWSIENLRMLVSTQWKCFCTKCYLPHSHLSRHHNRCWCGEKARPCTSTLLMDCLLPAPLAMLWQSQEWFTCFINILSLMRKQSNVLSAAQKLEVNNEIMFEVGILYWN